MDGRKMEDPFALRGTEWRSSSSSNPTDLHRVFDIPKTRERNDRKEPPPCLACPTLLPRAISCAADPLNAP